jgi:hypothetical protein
MTHSENDQTQWNSIYQIGGLAAIGAVVVGVLEIVITFLPGGNVPRETVLEWFQLFRENPFMGLRNLGLLNIMLNTLATLIFFALYAAHRQNQNQPYAALAALIALLGIGVFYATNRAFAMLDLSQQYAAATTEAQRAIVEAAGQAMLSVGKSHTPGTFLGFSLIEAAGVMMSVVMLRGRIFNQAAAYAGMLGFGMLLLFEFFSSFVAGLNNLTMILAMIGGLASMAWYILMARGLFQLGRKPAVPSKT